MFNMRKLALSLALMTASAGAMADSFTFDPTGTPGAAGNITLGSFDQAPGNALAIGGGGVLAGGAHITVLYQANLNTGNDATPFGTPIFLNGTGGNFFTFVAGYGEVVSSGGGPTAGFSFDPTNSVNFFKIYASNAPGNNLTGAGFTNGTLILSGVVLPTGYSSSFSQNVPAGLSNFDQFLGDGDNYPGFKSINGGGGTHLTAMVTSLNAAYFPDLTVGSSLSFFDVNSNVPFTTVDPSQAFINTTGTASAVTAPNLGAQNGGAGSGANFQLLADASSTFTRVPEPDSLALLGLGLGLVALVGKRRSKKVAA